MPRLIFLPPHRTLRLGAVATAAVSMLLLLQPVTAVTAESSQRLPALGDSVSEDLDLPKERRLGDNIMRDIRRDPDYLDDPLLNDYLAQLFQPLLQSARDRGSMDADLDRAFAWQTFLVRDRAVNAFALPGGYVGVYLGLLALTATPDELASVLAHELTHVTQRHIARSMSNASRQGMATMAAMLLGVLATARSGNVDGVQAVVVGSQAVMAQGQLNFSRDMEREADRIGLDLMGDAGFASAGMAGMFEKLDSASRLNDSGQYPYLRSHPLTSERISEARLRITEAPPRRGPSLLTHALMQARARVLMDATEPAWRRLQAQGLPGAPAADNARLAALYAAGMASIKLRDLDRADQVIAEGGLLARRQFAAEPSAALAFDLLRIDSLAERAHGRQGEVVAGLGRQMASVLQPRAADRSRILQLARAQVALARAAAGDEAAAVALKASTEELQVWVAEHPRDALAWQALAQCAEGAGQPLRSLRAGGESAYARGDLTGAVDRFRAAQKAARAAGPDQYLEAAIIESRLREVEIERRRLMAEARGERSE